MINATELHLLFKNILVKIELPMRIDYPQNRFFELRRPPSLWVLKTVH